MVLSSKSCPVVWACLVLAIRAASGQDTIQLLPDRPGSLVCWTENRETPRILKMHFIRADLTCPLFDLTVFPGEDPDGLGPAESTLTPPEELFTYHRARVAVNANAFAGLPGTEKDIRGWYTGRPVDIHGLVVAGERVISPEETGRTAFWMDSLRKPHIGPVPAGVRPVAAVADWGQLLLKENRILPDSATEVLHPRTAMGFDNTGKWLILLVIDGRQRGYSEGVSLFELARVLQAHGCTEAINLDGGGSSILLIRGPDGKPKTVNRPSEITHRPVPVMIGIR